MWPNQNPILCCGKAQTINVFCIFSTFLFLPQNVEIIRRCPDYGRGFKHDQGPQASPAQLPRALPNVCRVERWSPRIVYVRW